MHTEPLLILLFDYDPIWQKALRDHPLQPDQQFALKFPFGFVETRRIYGAERSRQVRDEYVTVHSIALPRFPLPPFPFFRFEIDTVDVHEKFLLTEALDADKVRVVPARHAEVEFFPTEGLNDAG